MAARKCFRLLAILLPLFVLGLLSLPSMARDFLLSDKDVLYPGDSLTSGSYSFTLQRDCDLVLSQNGTTVWATGTGGKAPYPENCRAKLQRDRNFVLYADPYNALWASNTEYPVNHNYVLILRRDGNVVIYDPNVWASATNTYDTGVTIADDKNETAASAVVVANAAGRGDLGLGTTIELADDLLLSGQSLSTGQFLKNGPYTLAMQFDCNLVLYGNGLKVWSTGTTGRGAFCKATMQRDANLVVYSDTGKALWSSNSAWPDNDYVLVLQGDRNLVIYGPSVWTSGSGVTVVGAKDETAASDVVVANAAGGGDLVLGRKIDMVTNQAA